MPHRLTGCLKNIGRAVAQIVRVAFIYSLSNPELSNFNVRQFSVTVRTTLSGAPEGISASISSVTVTLAPRRPLKCWTTALAI